MVNDLGGELNIDIWCDRKTVGRHIKLLSAAGYKIVFNKDKGYYLESSNFDLHETELLKSIIAESNISDAKKQALVRKLIKQQHNPTKTSIRKFLREETKLKKILPNCYSLSTKAALCNRCAKKPLKS